MGPTKNENLESIFLIMTSTCFFSMGGTETREACSHSSCNKRTLVLHPVVKQASPDVQLVLGMHPCTRTKSELR